jgi:uracil-DNA glycosylase
VLPPADARTRRALEVHQTALRQCRQCPDMHPPSIVGEPVCSPVMILGQAPGRHEGELGRPFAWTAGKTMFQWFARIGLPEEAFRQRVYMAAVCRCFPGPQPKGGDRVPSRAEIERCHAWLAAEVAILAPRLLIPVGRLAISQVMPVDSLTEVVGRQHRVRLADHELDAIPLPHPSGVSTWHRTTPGKDLLDTALGLIAGHEAFAGLMR